MTAMVSKPDAPPTEFTDYGWSDAELGEVEARVNGLPLWKPSKAGVSHNGPPETEGDPGPDKTYRITFRIPEYVSREKVREFERILQEQGPFSSRLAALDQAAYRVRAAQSVTARAYRVYDAILDISRGNHRCSLQYLDKIGYLAGAADRSVASKVISELEEGGHVATLKFTEGPLGAPTSRRLFIAPIVLAEDRARITSTRVYEEADAAKASTLRKRAEEARNRRKGASDQSDERSGHGVNYGVVDVAATTCSGRGVNGVVDKSPKRSGRSGNSVYHNSNTTEEDQGAPSAASSSSPPLDRERLTCKAEHNAAARARVASALNPEAAYAFRNIKVEKGGLVIGEELRTDLRNDKQRYTDAEIDMALPRALERAGGSTDPTRILPKIRWALSYVRQDKAKQAAPKPKSFGTSRYS
jgi:hypothetical protein